MANEVDEEEVVGRGGADEGGVRGINDSDNKAQSLINLTNSITTIILSIVAIGGLVFTARTFNSTNEQIRLAEQGQITERFSSATVNLGSDQVAVRLGAIFSLERLARDSPADQSVIMETLSAFIRQNSSTQDGNCVTPRFIADGAGTVRLYPDGMVPEPKSDSQAAISVIGRRNTNFDSSVELDLTDSCLVNFSLKGNFARVDFSRSNLSFVGAIGTDFSCADLGVSTLQYAVISESNLTGASFQGSDLTEAVADGANFNSTNLMLTTLTRTALFGAKMRHVNFIGANAEAAKMVESTNIGGDKLAPAELDEIFYSPETKWPAELSPPASLEWDKWSEGVC